MSTESPGGPAPGRDAACCPPALDVLHLVRRRHDLPSAPWPGRSRTGSGRVAAARFEKCTRSEGWGSATSGSGHLNGTVVTMNGGRDVLEGARVVISKGRIEYVGKPRARRGPRRSSTRGLRRHPRGSSTPTSRLPDPGPATRPTATSCSMLRERIWPFEALPHQGVDAGLRRPDLPRADPLRSTAALDMGSVRHYGEVFESARVSGSGCGGKS